MSTKMQTADRCLNTSSLLRWLGSLKTQEEMRLTRLLKGRSIRTDRLWLQPWEAMQTPDPWQRLALKQLVTLRRNVLLLCSRGAGKSKVVGCAAYLEAALGGFSMIVSRSDRQSMKVFEYASERHAALGLVSAVKQTAHEMRFENGGRLLSLPCREDTIRGEHGVSLLILDEAARIPDNVYGAVTPMTAVSGGRLALMSTPFGQRGFFYQEWMRGDGWVRHRHPWHECPRIRPEFVEQERRQHGDLWVRQEYLDCAPGEEFLAAGSGPFDPAAYAECVRELPAFEW